MNPGFGGQKFIPSTLGKLRCVRQRIDAHIAQGGQPISIEDMVVAIFAGVRGYLDKFDLGRVGAFEAQFISELKAREPAILDAIRVDQEIKPATEKSLIAFLDAFSKSFT